MKTKAQKKTKTQKWKAGESLEARLKRANEMQAASMPDLSKRLKKCKSLEEMIRAVLSLN
jgi:hypothetical protein